VVSIAVILTLGLLAFAPMGPAAAEIGIPAAFLSSSVGGLVMAILARSTAGWSPPSCGRRSPRLDAAQSPLTQPA
jgi:glutaminase